MARVISKIVFKDSSDDDDNDESHTVEVKCDNLTCAPEDLLDLDHPVNADIADALAEGAEGTSIFVEDIKPDHSLGLETTGTTVETVGLMLPGRQGSKRERLHVDSGEDAGGEGLAVDGGHIAEEGGVAESEPENAPSVKETKEGYMLSLHPGDIQGDYGDDGEDEEEDLSDEEEDDFLDTLQMISAIEQLVVACKLYRVEEPDGGASASAVSDEVDEKKQEECVQGSESELSIVPSPEEGGSEPRRQRPHQFDDFVRRATELLGEMRKGEKTPEEVANVMADDVIRLKRAFMRLNRPMEDKIVIDGVKMDI